MLSTRLSGLGATIFAEMTRLAQETGALNLGQGFPDESGPPEVLAAAAAAIADGHNQYPPAAGIPGLREAIATRRAASYGVRYDPGSEVLVTAGATEALAATLIALCEPGDEVVMFEPYYDCYTAAVAIAGARHRGVLLTFDGERFAFDPGELRCAITPRTRLILLNSPHNPTGKVFSRSELMQIAQVCTEHDLLAVTDEVYEYLVYDSVPHVPLASLPGMAERTLTVSSAGKTFAVTGWKVGWVCGPSPLITAVRTVKQYLTFAGGTPFQDAVAVGLRTCMPWVEEQRMRLQRRRDILAGALRAAGVTTYPTQGTYFLQAEAGAFGHADGPTLCISLPRTAGVAAIPSAEFYDRKAAGRTLIRLAFCKNDDVLTEAARRLARAAQLHQGVSEAG